MRSRRARQCGSALAELALLAPVFGILLAGTSYFGFAFYSYNRLERAVHDAGRYASTRTLLMTSNGITQFQTQVRNVVVYGSPEGGDTLSSPRLTNTADVTVQILNRDGSAAVASQAPRPERIRITITSWSIPGSFRTVTLSNKPSVDFPFIGRYVVPSPDVI